MSEEWRNETATEQQKEKLRFFGCTWDDGITAGQASDALEECAEQFPNAEADYQKSQPATEMQKEKLRFFGCTWDGDIRSFVGLLNVLDQNPGRDWQSFLGDVSFAKTDNVISIEEEIANGVPPPADIEDNLASFKL